VIEALCGEVFPMSFFDHHKVKTTGFSRSALAEKIGYTGGVAWIMDMEVIRFVRLNVEMIKQYLEHHFEPNPNDNFKMEPE
jgi:hypothetical protein